MTEMIKSYKIRNKLTGLYSTGGSMPSWKAIGKTWSGIGPLKGHLNMIYNEYSSYSFVNDPYENAEVVELVEIVVRESETSNGDLIKDYKAKARAEYDERSKKYPSTYPPYEM